jgi:hypothetical protein
VYTYEAPELRNYVLNAAINEIGAAYYAGNKPNYRGYEPLGYAIYYLPRNFLKIELSLFDLFRRDLLPHNPTVL